MVVVGFLMGMGMPCAARLYGRAPRAHTCARRARTRGGLAAGPFRPVVRADLGAGAVVVPPVVDRPAVAVGYP